MARNPSNAIESLLPLLLQSPHDDVSEMIGCDATDCPVEWFHFECVGIMVRQRRREIEGEEGRDT